MTLSVELDWPDVYFTPQYGASAAVLDGGTWHCARGDRDRILVPYIARPIDAGSGGTAHADAASPYGYCGLYADPGGDPGELTRFWNQTRQGWREQGIVTVFLRFSPMDPGSLRAARHLDGLELTRRGDTVLVPTGAGRDALWAGMASRSRNMVRKAEKAGLTASVRAATTADVAPGAPFRRLYEQTMDRVGGAAKYYFTDAYYRALLDCPLHLATVCDAGGTVVAASLVLSHGDRAHYHLACSERDGARLGANNLLVWTILTWAEDGGRRLVHLGGGVSNEDSLFAFKSSFGGERAQFWTGAVVVDPAAYAALTAAREEALGTSLADSAFFPRYRAG
jgi:hypothetical protein